MSQRNYGRGVARRPRKLKADGTPRKKPTDWEGQEQAVVMRWLEGESMRGTPVGELWEDTWHPPNGGYRLGKEAGRMKAQGVKAGIPDIQVQQARGGWHGLVLELKATPPRDAALSDSQRKRLGRAGKQGYLDALARGFEEAKKVLREYASWPRTEVVGERLALETGTEWRRGDDDGDGTGSDETDTSREV